MKERRLTGVEISGGWTGCEDGGAWSAEAEAERRVKDWMWTWLLEPHERFSRRLRRGKNLKCASSSDVLVLCTFCLCTSAEADVAEDNLAHNRAEMRTGD